jgi:hypothetical protein
MTDVTLHFDVEPGQNRAVLAQELQERCAELFEIEAARSNPMDTRVVGADDILLVLTVSAKILGAGALTLEGLHRVLVGVKKIANDLGVKSFTIEGDGGLVSPEELTEGDAKFIDAASKPAM